MVGDALSNRTRRRAEQAGHFSGNIEELEPSACQQGSRERHRVRPRFSGRYRAQNLLLSNEVGFVP